MHTHPTPCAPHPVGPGPARVRLHVDGAVAASGQLPAAGGAAEADSAAGVAYTQPHAAAGASDSAAGAVPAAGKCGDAVVQKWGEGSCRQVWGCGRLVAGIKPKPPPTDDHPQPTNCP
eukprot:357111-Chlamydomonas_euryale.AAC.2